MAEVIAATVEPVGTAARGLALRAVARVWRADSPTPVVSQSGVGCSEIANATAFAGSAAEVVVSRERTDRRRLDRRSAMPLDRAVASMANSRLQRARASLSLRPSPLNREH